MDGKIKHQKSRSCERIDFYDKQENGISIDATIVESKFRERIDTEDARARSKDQWIYSIH